MNTFASPQNKWLIVMPTVVLTDVIDPVIFSLDAYFASAGYRSRVTSGLRTPLGQLRIIQNYCRQRGVDKEFPEIDTAIPEDRTSWQGAWSRLLNTGIIINPPSDAEVLFDYVRNGVNKKGQIIHGSPHFRGTAFDIGGGADGIIHEQELVSDAMRYIPQIKGTLPERENNALHVDCT